MLPARMLHDRTAQVLHELRTRLAGMSFAGIRDVYITMTLLLARFLAKACRIVR